MSLFNTIIVALCGFYLLRYLYGLLRTYFVDKLTAVNDLALLGEPRSSSEKLIGTAVIAGGSLAGLLAARVCSDHFESVLIVEPEEGLNDYNYTHFTADTDTDLRLPKRARVSQYNAAHGYQVLTLRALNKFFPRFEDSLRAWGGRVLPADFRLHISGRLISPPEGLSNSNKTLFASRHLYESLLRTLVTRTCANVRFMHGSVVGIVVPSDHARTHSSYLSGVKIRAHQKESVRDAVLLVDCTGVAQAGLAWLEKAGYRQSANLRVSYDPRFRGTTCHFRVPERIRERLGAIYLYIPDPQCDTRNFYIQRVERDWLQIVCAGYNIPDRISSLEDVNEFFTRTTPSVPLPRHIRAFPESLSHSSARPQGWQYFRLSNVSFIRYNAVNANSLPANFVALGDAVARMNPIHGQGATLAIVGALTLNGALVRAPKGLPHDFAHKFFVRLATRIAGTWEANKCNDYGFSTTERTPGDHPRYGAFHRWYSSHLVDVASRDVAVAESMWEVLNFLAPGTDLFAPFIMCKVLWNSVMKVIGR